MSAYWPSQAAKLAALEACTVQPVAQIPEDKRRVARGPYDRIIREFFDGGAQYGLLQVEWPIEVTNGALQSITAGLDKAARRAKLPVRSRMRGNEVYLERLEAEL
jgi:hypothetical protein